MSTARVKRSHKLISANKVEGTRVFNKTGKRVGRIDDLMIDKVLGTVTYAIMSFDGFLGMGEKHHPIPWSMLTYDVERDGYCVDVTEEQLHGAPSFDRTQPVNYSGDALYDLIHKHYEIPPAWGNL